MITRFLYEKCAVSCRGVKEDLMSAIVFEISADNNMLAVSECDR